VDNYVEATLLGDFYRYYLHIVVVNDKKRVHRVNDNYAAMLIEEMKKLTQEVKNLNTTLDKLDTNANLDFIGDRISKIEGYLMN
jgi:hypothetical protein